MYILFKSIFCINEEIMYLPKITSMIYYDILSMLPMDKEPMSCGELFKKETLNSNFSKVCFYYIDPSSTYVFRGTTGEN